jgi:hypothetical protein
MEVNRTIDNLIDNPEPFEPNPPRSEVVYHILLVGGEFGSSTTSRRRIWIVYHESEEDLDNLPQVRGGLAAIHRWVPVSADYSDFINDALPLSNGHQGLMAPPTWSGGPGHRKGTESSKLPGLAHSCAPSTPTTCWA